VDYTRFPDGFRTGRFETSGPLPATASRHRREELEAGILFRWRVLTRHGDAWVPSKVGSFYGPTCIADQIGDG
jgi:hypothetical protein